MWLYSCHILWFPFFFLTFYGTSLTKRSINITCYYIFVTFDGSLIFFLTFDGTILVLWSTNIICNCTFVTFYGSFIFFFPTLMVPSSYWGVLSFWVFDFLLLSLNFSIVYASLFSFVSLKFFSTKPSTRTYLKWRLLNKTLSKTHKRRNRSLSHERYLISSSEGIVLAKQ